MNPEVRLKKPIRSFERASQGVSCGVAAGLFLAACMVLWKVHTLSQSVKTSNSQSAPKPNQPAEVAPLSLCMTQQTDWLGLNADYDVAPKEDQGPLKPGEMVFTGYGIPLYEGSGHGIGAVQTLMQLMAKKGMSVAEIVAISFPGSHLAPAPEDETIYMQGIGPMTLKEYVARLGEVPDKACGTDKQVKERPDKYIPDDGTCYDAAAIEAQADMAASYALSIPHDKDHPLTGTTADQVIGTYPGKAWTTENLQVIENVKDQIMTTYYSARPISPKGGITASAAWVDMRGNPQITDPPGTVAMCYQDMKGLDMKAFFPELFKTWRTRKVTGLQIKDMLKWAGGSQVVSPAEANYLIKMTNNKNKVTGVQVVNNQNSAIAVQVVITFKNPDGTLSRQNVSGELFRRMFNGYFSGKLGQENNQLYGPVFNVAK